MENFTPLGTSETMTVRGVSGDTYETDVYPAGISGLGLCKPQDPRRVVEWCVIHRPSGMMLVMCKDGQYAVYAAHAMAHAVASAGCFWENDIETVVTNPEAMRRCREAVRVYAAV